MNRLILPIVAVLLTALLVNPVVANEPLKSGDWSYTVENGKAAIVGYTGAGGDVVFPSEIEGVPVTMLNRPDFGEVRESVTSLEIPDSVEHLNCGSFGGLTALTKVSLGKNVSRFGTGAFGGCTKLTTVSISPENAFLVSEDGVVFTKDKTELLRCLVGKTGEYTIPDTVKKIADQAFFGSQLSKVVIPEGVTDIGSWAFKDCNSLKSLTIPESVVTITDGAFGYGDDAYDTWQAKLEQIVVPSSFHDQLKRIGFGEKVSAKLGVDSKSSLGEGAKTPESSSATVTSLTVGDTTYENVTLKNEYPRSFFIQHKDGTAFVEKAELTEEQIAGLLKSSDG